MRFKAKVVRVVLIMTIALIFASVFGAKSWLFGGSYVAGYYKGFFIVCFVVSSYYIIKMVIRRLKEKTYYEIEDKEW